MFGVCSDVCFLHPLRFAPLQPFGAYPSQAYVQPGDGHWPTSGMHRVATPSTALSRGSLLLLNQLSSSHSSYMVGHTAFGASQIVTQSLHCPCMVDRGLLFQVSFHLMTNLVILDIRLMSLLTPGLQSSFLLLPIIILGSQVRCHH